jgi:hypothetical protein
LRTTIGRPGVGTNWRSTTADVIKIPRALEALEARANPRAGAEPQPLSTAAMRAAARR